MNTGEPVKMGRKRKMKRVVAMLLPLVMVCVLFTGTAAAESFTGIFAR